ncbi:choline-sulfatase [Salmonella enterica subsp. enterica serovar Choleraesuis]|nr:choline-sulfatase [Salmonella enterica subsp. enterica serovar Choleraesuis]
MATAFSVLAVLSNFFVLYLILYLICSPLVFINKIVRNIIVSILFGFSQILLYVDTVVFEQYRFHINQSVLTLVLSGQVVDFSLATYGLVALIFAVAFAVEMFFLTMIDRKISASSGKKIIVGSSIFTVIALLITNIGYMISFYYSYSPIMSVREYVPLYYPLTSKAIMGFFDKDGGKNRVKTISDYSKHLDYPLKNLVINPNTQKPKNIMFLVVDSWRYDTFTKEISPNMYNFTQQQHGVAMSNHFSTGNATRTGIFGMFYGIPGTYWDAFLSNSIPSLFITTLQKENYNLGVFTSAKVTFPEFDRTVFATVKNLRITSKGVTSPERDAQLTKDWISWYKARDTSRPTFSFLFYDAAHSYEFPANFTKFKPFGDLNYMTLKNDTDPMPLFNRYKNSVNYIDSVVQSVFDELKASGTLDNTLIIMTGDHAQEMNDNHMGFWGHNGNFTDAQTKVPFIVIGAGDNAAALQQNADKLTSHEDIVPTLMKHYLNVSNDTRDYSTGYDMFTPLPERPWLLMSNYSMWAVKTPDSIYQVNGVGVSHFMDKHNRDRDGQPNFKYVYDAMDEMRHFNKR